MVLHGIVWYCIILHHLAPSCTILHHLAPSCTILHDLAPCCTMLHHVRTMLHHVAPVSVQYWGPVCIWKRGWCWVTSRSGWLLELLTELIMTICAKKLCLWGSVRSGSGLSPEWRQNSSSLYIKFWSWTFNVPGFPAPMAFRKCITLICIWTFKRRKTGITWKK